MDAQLERIFDMVSTKFNDVRAALSKQNGHIQKLQREVEELRILAGLEEAKATCDGSEDSGL